MPIPVPQFIKEETKIMGLVTLTQLSILTAGGGFLIFLYFVLTFQLWAILALIGFPLILVITFGQVEGIPFFKILPYVIRHIWIPKSYLWYKEKIGFSPASEKEIPETAKGQKTPPKKKELDLRILEEISQYLDK